MQGLKQQILSYWNGISLREQRMLVIALGFAFVAVFYWGGVQPSNRRVRWLRRV